MILNSRKTAGHDLRERMRRFLRPNYTNLIQRKKDCHELKRCSL